MKALLAEIKQCRICEAYLPNPPNPIVSASESASILITGQAPGKVVDETGIPWNDRSGDTLRQWLGVSEQDFYDPAKIALVPMGFCYPGKGKSGDLPPRPECAKEWHGSLLANMINVKLTLLIGTYAQHAYLNERRKENLTQTVKAFAEYLPEIIPLPHPSPRNRIWLSKNPWFEDKVIPMLQKSVSNVL